MLLKTATIMLIGLVLAGCTEQLEEPKEAKSTAKEISSEDSDLRSIERWYSQDMVNKGQVVFQQNCAICHGEKAQGVIHPWNQKLPGGKYPPPPLNGTAHAWHHPLKGLLFTISNGGAPVGGEMPSFKYKLTLQQQADAVAYFQGFWSDKIYQAWLDRGGLQK